MCPIFFFLFNLVFILAQTDVGIIFEGKRLVRTPPRESPEDPSTELSNFLRSSLRRTVGTKHLQQSECSTHAGHPREVQQLHLQCFLSRFHVP